MAGAALAVGEVEEVLQVRVHRRSLPTGGDFDFAAQFTGDDLLTAAQSGELSPGAGETLVVAFWLALDALPDGASLEVMNINVGATETDGWFVFVEDATNKIGIGYSDGLGGYFFLTGAALEADKWYFVAATWANGVNCNLFIDLYDTDALINNFSNSGSNNVNHAAAGPLKLGGGLGGQAGLTGRLDKAGIWGRGLTGPEVAALWNNGAGLRGTQADLTSLADYLTYYDLDEATGATTWPDRSGSFPATATGTVVRVPPAGQF